MADLDLFDKVARGELTAEQAAEIATQRRDDRRWAYIAIRVLILLATLIALAIMRSQ